MRAFPPIVVVALALGLTLYGCTGTNVPNNPPVISGMVSLDASPRAVLPGGTSLIAVIASDDGATGGLTYTWAVDDAAKGSIAPGQTAGTAVFTAAQGVADGTVATITVTVTDGGGAIATASVSVTISQDAGFVVPEGTNGYVGADTCAHCHSLFMTRWNGGAHATANYAGPRNNPGVDRGWSNVQCEDCHGPGHDHAVNPEQRSTATVPWDVIDVPDHTICQACHWEGTGAPPAYSEWAGDAAATPPIEASAHAAALEPMEGRTSDEAVCLDCHSAERILEYQDVEPPVAAETLVSAPITAENGITCLVCHRAHGPSVRDPNTSDDYGTSSLCFECHTSTEPQYGWDDSRNAPKQPRWNPSTEVMQSRLAFNADGTEFVGDPSPHLAVSDQDGSGDGRLCIACHAYRSATNSGHTFKFRREAGENRCQACHPTSYLDFTQPAIQARLNALRPYIPGRTSWGASFSRAQYDALSDADKVKYQIAVWNYALINRDGSLGAHNAAYARAVLSIAEDIINDLTGANLGP